MVSLLQVFEAELVPASNSFAQDLRLRDPARCDLDKEEYGVHTSANCQMEGSISRWLVGVTHDLVEDALAAVDNSISKSGMP